MKYCKKCGTALNDFEKCPNCGDLSLPKIISDAKDFVIKAVLWLLSRIGFCFGSSEAAINAFERNKKIIPDCFKPNQDEVTIKQYNIAKLRSRILQKYAEGRLQITNKRIIFRAAGFSLMGNTALQYEFIIGEIGGIDVKKTYRLSFLNLLLCLLLSAFIANPFKDMFQNFNDASVIGSYIVGCIISVLLATSLVLFKKKFWLKHILLSFSMGIMTGINNISSKLVDLTVGTLAFDFVDVISTIIGFAWLFNLIIVSLVPELRIVIRTKSASESVQIRKKVRGFFGKQPQEYTDFAEVLPWTDTDKAINELGALIDDLQTMGDYAIDKWKEEDINND